MPIRFFFALLLAGGVAACATDVRTDASSGRAQLVVQNAALNPRNGGLLVDAASLQPGDIILSSADGLTSAGIRMLTLSPVSHASIYVGDGQIAEAVGQGIRERGMKEFLGEESTVVAFRHPGTTPEHARKMAAFARQQVGRKYNYVGVMLQAPFSIERRVCELPLVPSPLRDFCVQGFAAVQLGLGRNDVFFCSQFVLEAYRRAGLPLTDADPRLMNPGDLLHMREGDVPSVRTHQALQYVGHLKFQPPATAGAL
ncbi:MAG: YiiX/YebB-like N1pC/P60 family cysteine hydrolase [Pseudomonadota bacterium]